MPQAPRRRPGATKIRITRIAQDLVHEVELFAASLPQLEQILEVRLGLGPVRRDEHVDHELDALQRAGHHLLLLLLFLTFLPLAGWARKG